MKRALTELMLMDCLFIIFLSLSGMLFGGVGGLFYVLAFALPTSLILLIWKRRDAEIFRISVTCDSSSLKSAALLAFPTVFVLLVVSFLTSILMQIIGVSAESAELTGNMPFLIITKAFAPAVFEEMFFRYIPIMGLGKHSPRLTVIYSSILFAFAHCNIFQIPYALVAGVIFCAVDLAVGSVLPSILIHFLNNVLSIIWQTKGEESVFIVVFLSAISLLALVSVGLILLDRKKMREKFDFVFKDKSKFMFTYILLYIAVTLFAAFESI